MENAVEALKIAFAVLMFVMALSLGISSISKANSAVEAVTKLNDRETEYSYVRSSGGLTRTVGAETIVPIMYKAYKENFEVRFLDKNGNGITIYYATDVNGNTKKDASGNIIKVTSINGTEVFANAQEAEEHLTQILGPKSKVKDKYKNQICYDVGFYDYLKGKKFTEELGEYYQNDDANVPEANKVKKRIITYTEQ